MLEEVKIIPAAYSPTACQPLPMGEYATDRALLELWPENLPPSPPRSPPPKSSTSSQTKKRESRSARRARRRKQRKKFLRRTANMPPVALPPAALKMSGTPRPRTRRVQVVLQSRPTKRDPSFDRALWRKGSKVQLFDKNAEQWVEAQVTHVQPNAFGAKGQPRHIDNDGLHLAYSPQQKLKGSWHWKDHKPTKLRPSRRRRVRAVKEDVVEMPELETVVLLPRTSHRLRAAIRVVWDEELKSYLHEEPEECTSSEEEPVEYSSGEEAEQFWTSFQTWRGDKQGAPKSWRAGGGTHKSSNSKVSRRTGQSRHTQATQKTQQSQGTFGSSGVSSKPSQVGSRAPGSRITDMWTCELVEEEEETESESSEDEGKI